MKEKIEQFLLSTLLAFALLLLLISALRPAAPVKTTAPTETTAATERPTEPLSDAMDEVTTALKKHPPAATTTARCIYDPELLAEENTLGSGQSAAAFALAKLCGEQKMNPIDGFWALVKEGIYDRSKDTSGVLEIPYSFVPLQSKRTYAFSVEGARELLTDVLDLSAGRRDGLPIEERMLGNQLSVDAAQIYQSAGDCFCAYFVCYGDRSAHFLCFYFRGEKNITDVEFQLMNLHYAAGDQDAVDNLDKAGDRQAVSLMTALELLMTGKTRAADGNIPFTYTLKDCSVGIDRYSLTGSGESGDLTCYRIHK